MNEEELGPRTSTDSVQEFNLLYEGVNAREMGVETQIRTEYADDRWQTDECLGSEGERRDERSP